MGRPALSVVVPPIRISTSARATWSARKARKMSLPRFEATPGFSVLPAATTGPFPAALLAKRATNRVTTDARASRAVCSCSRK
jgi:hypothetical protein